MSVVENTSSISKDLSISLLWILIIIGIIALIIATKKGIILKSEKSRTIVKSILKILGCAFWAYNIGDCAILPFILYSPKTTSNSLSILLIVYFAYALLLSIVVFILKRYFKRWLYILTFNVFFILLPLIPATIGSLTPSDWFVYNVDDYVAELFLSVATKLGFTFTYIFCGLAFLIYNGSLLIKYLVQRAKSKKVVDKCDKTKYSPNTESSHN